MSEPQIFALIIGTEILNRRREDKHFNFISHLLNQYGRKLAGSFIIEDNPTLIVQTIKFLASQPNSIIFSFGGIGSTPDDYTRKCVAIALRDGNLYTHPEIKNIIEERLGERAYPHAINMAEVPKGSKLIENEFNGMPAFSLDDKYFFVPGFPEMSHLMLTKIVKDLFIEKRIYYRYTLRSKCKETIFIDIMRDMPQEIEFSSLPKYNNGESETSISIASYSQELSLDTFNRYIKLLNAKNIEFKLED
ncbi:MAG: competence/damage-inducible protein A [Sulfurovum sp.]|nr:competence/damage-inducible protein A [Sulfurovaceae bacterium]